MPGRKIATLELAAGPLKPAFGLSGDVHSSQLLYRRRKSPKSDVAEGPFQSVLWKILVNTPFDLNSR